MRNRIVTAVLVALALAWAAPASALNTGVQRTLIEIFNDTWDPVNHQFVTSATLGAATIEVGAVNVTDRTTREIGVVSGSVSISNVPAVTLSGTQPVRLTNGAEIVVTALAPVSFTGTQPVSLTNGGAVGVTSLPAVYFSTTQPVDVSDRASRSLGSVTASISNVPTVTANAGTGTFTVGWSSTLPVAITNGATVDVVSSVGRQLGIVSGTGTFTTAFSGTQPVSLTNGGAVGITSLPAVYFSTTQPVDVSDRASRSLGSVTASISNVPAVTLSGTQPVAITNGAEIVVTAQSPISFSGTQPVSLTNGGAVGITSLPAVYFSTTQPVDVSDRASRSLGSVTASISNIPAVTLSGTQPVAITNGAEIVVTAIAPVSITGTPNVAVTNTPSVTVSGTPEVTISYASSTFARTTATSTDSGAALVFSGQARAWTVYNNGPYEVYLDFDAVATTSDMKVPAGGSLSGNRRVTTIHAICETDETAETQVYGEF